MESKKKYPKIIAKYSSLTTPTGLASFFDTFLAGEMWRSMDFYVTNLFCFLSSFACAHAIQSFFQGWAFKVLFAAIFTWHAKW